MPLTLDQMARLNRLLDEALDLETPARQRWLDALAPEDADLHAALQSALSRGDLAGLPLPILALQWAIFSPGQTVGPYRLIRELGRGGMAQVWLARRADESIKRDVALKIPSALHLRGDLAARFEREKDILAALAHPHIAPLYDAGISDEGLPYLAMEHVDGRPLSGWRETHQLSIRARIELFLQVLDAVGYAHGRGVLHRDIKPSNVLVTEGGQVRLLDFGVARLLRQPPREDLTQLYGQALTPTYASPEQLHGEDASAASDIYSLGVLLHELLTGALPYRSESGSLPGDLDAVISKAMAAKPEERYASAGDFAHDLRAYLEGRSVRARPATVATRLAKLVKRQPMLALAAAALALAVTVVTHDVLRKPGSSTEKAAPARPPAAASTKTIAVLPFTDLSEQHDQAYFSDGLAEELIDHLTKVPELQVTARASSFWFKGKPDDIASIGRKLNVANILDGSVRKAGDRLRVTTELIEAGSGREIWSETYDQELQDVFKVQDEITAAVVAALKVHLLPAEQLRGSRRTQNIDAYNEYLLGRQFADRMNLDDWRRAIKAYRKAIELDPGFAAAYAGLSISEFYEADQSVGDAGYEQKLAMAEKAVALAPDEAEGYAARGFLRRSVEWDWAAAEADLRRALALNPGSAAVRADLGELLGSLGRLPEAVALTRKAVELDPLSAEAWGDLSKTLFLLGQYEPARHASERKLEISPDDSFGYTRLGYVDLLEGRPAEALATFAKVKLEAFRLQGIAMAEHSMGRDDESRRVLAELISKRSQQAAFQIAEAYAWRGEKDKAFEWLERAYRQRDSGLRDVAGVPSLASLHGDPRFAALLRRMNLPEAALTPAPLPHAGEGRKSP